MTDESLRPTSIEELRELVETSFSSNTSLLVNGTGSKEGWGHPAEMARKLELAVSPGLLYMSLKN